MREDLLNAARQQAAEADPGVRAAALLRIARAEYSIENARARRTLQEALEQIRLHSENLKHLANEARTITAAVAPELLPTTAAPDRRRDIHAQFGEQSVVQAMLANGHLNEAFDYLLHFEDEAAFPFAILPNVLHKANSPTPETAARRTALLRKAANIWRTLPSDRGGILCSKQFDRVFANFWKDFPADEGRTIAHEIVKRILADADQRVQAQYRQDLQFTSARQQHLFEVIHALQSLDPNLAHSLLETNSELAAAVRRFPDGMETMRQEALAARPPRKAAGTGSGRGGRIGFIMFGDSEDLDRQRTLLNSMQSGEFEQSIEHALEKFREDTSQPWPNLAPKEYWPSTGEFRTILYRAGQRLGPEAAKFLDHIPDPDLRLFAMIELAAALAGAPESERHQMSQRNPESRIMRSPDGRLVRCPKCSVTPQVGWLWTCECGHHWNTFSTAGRCPACGFQWKETQCPWCSKWSEHQAWYVDKT